MTLNDALLAAHANGDGAELVRLYTQAADQADGVDAECFFLTHAYVFALELGLPEAGILNMRLVAHDRVHPLTFKKDVPNAH
ncbi:hypothetical protein SAMN04488515_2079 [Cognatiyoonia koreensis]|uniref:Uncharacterized protein n=1 Tax=Cognatiyoonia koreensis TaxID=364200 RepID=A0A1I0QPP4_9RHOB|nr:hypothetical protein [Cognatiyoonia koreensis]SEW29364.1 hypothetical protein SAMN04488515_2079 [Cognatiyoonia koreensis]